MAYQTYEILNGAEMFKKTKELKRKIRDYEKYINLFEQRFGIWPQARDFVMRRGGMYMPDYANPKTFQEKLNWITEMYYRRSPIFYMVENKVGAKIYFREKLGNDEHIVKTYGIYNTPDDIDWATLPNSFVIKTTMGWTGANVIIVPDKRKFNPRRHRKVLDAMTRSLHDGAPCPIIIEEYLDGFVVHNGLQVIDYKIFCFNGRATFARIHSTPIKSKRFGSHDKNLTFYSLPDFQKLPITHNEFKYHPNPDVPRPECLGEMIQIAEKLAAGFPIARIDMYVSNGHIYIGEMTILGGVGHVIDPLEYDYKFGDMISLPSESEIPKLIDKDCREIGDIIRRHNKELSVLSDFYKYTEMIK